MQLIGYIAQCHDHEYVIVSQFKPEEQDDNKGGIKVYVISDEMYSTAVDCHAKGVPAVLYIPAHSNMIAIGIKPVDNTNPTGLGNQSEISERLEDIRLSANGAGCRLVEIQHAFKECIQGILTAFSEYQRIINKIDDATDRTRAIGHLVERIGRELDQKRSDGDTCLVSCKHNEENSDGTQRCI